MVLTPELQEKFLTLACRLSPENLTCDGELPQSEVKRRAREIWREWTALEIEVGREVTEAEVWANDRRGNLR